MSAVGERNDYGLTAWDRYRILTEMRTIAMVGLSSNYYNASSFAAIYLDANGYDIVRPELGDSGMSTQPMLDLSAGYVQRAHDQLPKQGEGDPWRVQMNYYHDVEQLRHGSVTDPHLHFGAANHAVSRIPEEPAWV